MKRFIIAAGLALALFGSGLGAQAALQSLELRPGDVLSVDCPTQLKVGRTNTGGYALVCAAEGARGNKR